MSDPQATEPRHVVRIGKYEVVKHIATGGMGAVYRARDPEKNREVALKVLTPDLAAKPVMVERFRREARNASKLQHENIVSVYEFGESTGTYFIAMEFVEGVDLHEYIVRKKTLDPEVSRQIIIQAAEALEHARVNGIVHRDIKPSNFLLRRKQGKLVLKLTDFGLAREETAEEFRVTRDGTTVGTVDYISPEQARDSSLADTRSDLYSLGCTWYHMLAGRPPFTEGGLAERLMKHMMEKPPSVRRFNRRISPDLAAVVSKLLEKNPEERFQTPSELLDVLNTLPALAESVSAFEATQEMPCPESSEEDFSERQRPDTIAENNTQMFAKAPSQGKLRGPRAPIAPSSKLLKNTTSKIEKVDPTPPPSSHLIYGIGAAVVLLILVVVGFLQFSGGQQKANTPLAEVEAAPIQIPVPPKEPVIPGDQQVVVPKIVVPVPVTDGKVHYPALYKQKIAFNREELQREVEAPWSQDAALPTATVLRVLRVVDGEPRTYSSLGAALAAAPANGAVIEICDQGPLFETGGSATGKHITIRAAKGFRPLLIWDVARVQDDLKQKKIATEAYPLTFIDVKQGSLTLEGLELALRWRETDRAGSMAWLNLADADFTLRNCVVSMATPPGREVTVARFQGKSRDQATRCRVERCFLRGTNLKALDLQTPLNQVLIQDSLMVGGEPTLLECQVNKDKAGSLALVRSTLVCGKTLLSLPSAAPGDLQPLFKIVTWDALLSRSATRSGGELLAVSENPNQLRFNSVNSLFAGWQALLRNKTTTLLATNLYAWQAQWQRSEGEVALQEVWPTVPFLDLEDVPASKFRTQESRDPTVCYRSTESDTVPLGCNLDALPLPRDTWIKDYLEPMDAVAREPMPTTAPAIPSSTDNLYTGESIVLDNTRKNFDLGDYLNRKQREVGFGPRVVIRLSGSGQFPLSPVKIERGISLVLFVESGEETSPGRDKLRPIVFELKRLDDRDPTAGLIEMVGGSLTLTNVELRLRDFEHARDLPAWMLRVHGGDLTLDRCKLSGPQVYTPAGYQGLVDFQGAGDKNADRKALCTIRESILLSSREGVLIQGIGARLQILQSLLVAGHDPLRFNLGADCKGNANLICQLERTTLAGKHCCLALDTTPGTEFPVDPIRLQTEGCAFLAPFAGQKAGLLLGQGAALAQGLLLWQGNADVLDPRLQYLMASDQAIPEAPSLTLTQASVWRYPLHQAKAALMTWQTPGTLEDRKPYDLHRLALPAPRGSVVKAVDSRPLGADLELLGILKKPIKRP